MIRVYVAGPITKGNTMHNIYKAIKAGDELLELGFAPFIPHVTCLWDIVSPHTYEQWCKWDNEWLKQCQAVLRIPGESVGADAECELAAQLGIPVFTTFPTLVAWARTQ
jgi:hypothetical protein